MSALGLTPLEGLQLPLGILLNTLESQIAVLLLFYRGEGAIRILVDWKRRDVQLPPLVMSGIMDTEDLGIFAITFYSLPSVTVRQV